MKQIFPINTTKEGLAPTITSHYHKAGGGDFYPANPQVPHLAILEIEEMEEPKIIQVGNYMDDTGRGFRNPQCGRVYSVEGISPTINTCGSGDREPKILQVGSYSPTSACNGKVLDANGICPTLLDHKGAEPAVIEVVSCAIRGRNPGNPSDRRAGTPTEQRLELGGDVANCLTSVQKDSMVAETCICGYTRDSKGNIQNYHERDIAGTLHTSTGNGGNTDQFVKGVIVQNAHGYNKGGLFEDISPTVTSSAFQDNNFVIKKYRIRRLTERECFRLLGMDDADIDKIDAYRIRKTLKNGKVKDKPISKSAKYRMAGNSIVIDCLYHIFYQMFIAEPPKPQPKQLTLFD